MMAAKTRLCARAHFYLVASLGLVGMTRGLQAKTTLWPNATPEPLMMDPAIWSRRGKPSPKLSNKPDPSLSRLAIHDNHRRRHHGVSWQIDLNPPINCVKPVGSPVH
jgi:hypothetical protein